MNLNSKKRIAQSKQVLAPLGNIEARSQFGGYRLSIEEAVFAIISDGELYLRASAACEPMFKALRLTPLIFTKRGRPLVLSYYQVDEALWRTQSKLLTLARLSLQGAKLAHSERKRVFRLKDLPNLGYSLEQLLWKAGIQDIETLRNKGAKACYLKLCRVRKTVGLDILLALAGAINGCHREVLPQKMRSELTKWYAELQRGAFEKESC